VGKTGVEESSANTIRADAVARLSRLSVAVVADVLDRLGLRSQVLNHRIRPLTKRHAIAGHAYPIQAVPMSVIPDNPYEHEIAAIDAVPSGAVVVIATGGCYDAAIWGELLCTRAAARGAVGAVIDGAVRDLAGLNGLNYPTFAAAVNASDARGRLAVISYGSPIACAGVGVTSSDLVLGDLDGVVVVPGVAAKDALVEAEAKQSKEHVALELLADGTSIADVYARHQVL
jgi:4-hydroxy-4-methyl-2-oxoglutarate aldolase